MNSALAVIPARGGSKRIERKNIADFCGRPMLSFIVETAQESGLFQEILVSTDDEEIAEIATRCGVPPAFSRPANLAGDDVGIIPVVRHAMQEFHERGRSFESIVMLMACAPLLHADDLRGAHELFQRRGGVNPVLGVTPFPVPTEWSFQLNAENLLEPDARECQQKAATELPSRYYDAGQFCFFAEAHLSTDWPMATHTFAGYELPSARAIDIDTPEDWQLAEAVYRGMQRA